MNPRDPRDPLPGAAPESAGYPARNPAKNASGTSALTGSAAGAAPKPSQGATGKRTASGSPGTAPGNGGTAPGNGKGAGEAGPGGAPFLPAIGKPSGGGAIRGIGEKFSVKAATGTASLSVPLAMSPGRNGFAPQFELGYDSGNGNGPFGLGFQLSVPTISRKTELGLPRYVDGDETDVFILSGAEELVPMRDTATGGFLETPRGVYRARSYRPRVEGTFSRIERWIRLSDGDSHWRVTSRDNITNIYGQNPVSRIRDPGHPAEGRSAKVFAWLLEETQDDRGNVIRYEHKAEDGVGVDPGRPSERTRFDTQGGVRVFAATAQRYLKRVLYCNAVPFVSGDFLMEMVFDYGEHGPAVTTPASVPSPAETLPWPVRGDPFSNYRPTFEVRSYRLCRRVLMFHRLSAGRDPILVKSTDFFYDPGPAFTYLTGIVHAGYLFDPAANQWQRGVLPTLSLEYSRPVVNDTLSELPRESLEGLEGGIDGEIKQWVDLDGEGIPGVLIDASTAWYYKSNAGQGRLAPPRALVSLPSPSDLAGGVQTLQDLGGDGQLDLVAFQEPVAGFFPRSQEGSFEAPRGFAELPNIDWGDPNLRFVDLDGDGLGDLLITEDDAFTWYRSLGKKGFEMGRRVVHPSDDQRGPAVVFADDTHSIQLADMSGSGLVDIVRIRNGEVCYWPNLGFGRFGKKVTLENSPVFAGADEFDARRVRFGDIDGSGTSDVFYLGAGGVTLYFNRAGNSLSARTDIHSLPPVDNLAQVGIVDLLGQGTACLVWSSPLPSTGRPVRFVDLMAGRKPHLLRAVTNNLGAETRLAYAASTKFYLSDKAAGTPWLTRLAFPVHVVERIEHIDAISGGRLSTTYAYRHGFFDGVEREFRGFARVEQIDAEQFPAGAAGTEEFQPPTRTVTWFHTGAWFDRKRLENLLADEYFQQGPVALRLPDTLLSGALAIPDEREAVRALRGLMLRQEVYADDAADNPVQALVPFQITEQNFEVRMLQAVDGERHGVFLPFPRETVSIHSERNPSDPRVSHDLVVDVDPFGNVTRKASLAYPRAGAPQPEQGKVWAILNEAAFINHAGTDFHRVGVPFEDKAFEVSDLPGVPFAGQGLLTLAAFRSAVDAIDSAHEFPYEATPSGTGPKRRLVEHKQQIYYRNDLAGSLPLGQIESLALPYESYQLAFTAGLASEIVRQSQTLSGTPFDPSLLLTEGHYVRRLPDTGYWSPSGRLVFDPARFYLSTEGFDPFGQRHFVTFDDFSLLMVAIRDPLGNIVGAVNDYRVLEPVLVTDANLNRFATAYDALGMVVATAAMGKEGSSDGDTLAEPTTHMEYDLLRWQVPNALGERLPVVVHNIAREQHGPANVRFQHSFTYSDGFGRVVMQKIQAEPGNAPLRGADGKLLRNPDGSLVVGPVAARWVGTGRILHNNKGNPVKEYEPFFSSTFEYEDEADLVEWGVTPIVHYDALDRVVLTELPNGAVSRVQFGTWDETAFDPNDAVTGTRWLSERQAGSAPPEEQRAAALTLEHAGTPSRRHLDSQGRTFLMVAHNRIFAADGSFTDAFYETRTAFDVEGNAIVLTDARQAIANPANPVPALRQRFDVLSRRLRTDSADAGARLGVLDVGGKPIRQWDSRGQIIAYRYDALQRQTHLFVQQTVAERPGQDLSNRLLIRAVFGEALDPPGPAPTQAASASPAQLLNLRGNLYRTYDCAGLSTNVRFDFKANLEDTERRLAREYRSEPNWIVLPDPGSPAAIQSAAEALLDPVATAPRTVFAEHSDYDALNRVARQVSPDGSIATPIYNEAGLLEQVAVTLGTGPSRTVIAGVEYNARGQRLQYDFADPTTGSTAVTCRVRYAYDPFTFQMTRILTTRTADNAVLQDLRYTYDPVGNLVQMRDRADTAPIFGGATPASGDGLYRYDPLYRLIEATGREHPGQAGISTQPRETDIPVGPIPHPNDLQSLVRYLERYAYDPVGNMLQVVHTTTASGGGTGPSQTQWTRRYNYAADSNRLLGTSLPGDPSGAFSATYGYTAHGAMSRMPHLAAVDWDYADRMQHADLGGGGDAYFVYDGSGQRVRKVWEHSGLVEERIYVGGWETFRRRSGTITGPIVLERETLSVMDDRRRVAMVETKITDTSGGGPTPPVWRFQHGNSVGSALLELSASGAVISYEEFHPYGSTAFHAASGAEVSAKRYRYGGKERDEETGLYYFGARYYAAWLGRWTAADPAGMRDGPNLYGYARDNPTSYQDSDGQSVAKEVLYGDFHEGDSSWTSVGLNVVVGVIPIVGQIADARDTLAAIKNVAKDPKSGGAWLGLGLAAVGWIPIAGDAIKGGKKVAVQATKEAAKEASERAAKELAEKAAKEAADKAAKEAAEKAAKEAADKAAKEAADKAAKEAAGKAAKSAEKKATKEVRPSRSGTYNELRKAEAKDAHHIIQDAAVRDLPGYSHGKAPALELPGPSTNPVSPHGKATQVQRQAGGGTYASERRIGYKALRKAGLSPEEARAHIKRADAYFKSLGVTPATRTRIPGNR